MAQVPYSHVLAPERIYFDGALAFAVGDPVPEPTADGLGLLDPPWSLTLYPPYVDGDDLVVFEDGELRSIVEAAVDEAIDDIGAVVSVNGQTGAVDLSGTYVGATGGGEEVVETNAAAGSSATLDLESGNVFVLTNPIAAGTCTLTLAGATAGRSCGCTVIFHQPLSGDSNISFAGTVVPMNDGGLPGPAQVSNGIAVYSLLTLDGGVTIYAWKVGDSEASTPPAAPDAPTAVVGTRGNGQVSVAFAPGASNGSAITGYTVTSSPGSFTGTGFASPIQVTGLANGTSYTFTVRATNGIGNSPESAPSAAVTPATTPGAPTIGTATGGNTTATVNWTPPASNGGSAVTGYVVKLYRASDNVEIGSATPGNVTTHTFTGLPNGTAVSGKVAAINAVGTGSQSPASNNVTPAAGPSVPGPPTIGIAAAGNTEATANWTAPVSDGGAAITGYEVKTYDGAGTLLHTGTVGVVLTFLKTGLANGVDVKFKVAAINAIGTGAQSAFSNTVTPAPPFEVDGLSGLIGWFKADALSLSNNDPVGSWINSATGGAGTPGQSNAAAKPTYKTNIINGLPVVRFDGVDDWLSWAVTASQPITAFIVHKFADLADAILLGSQGGGMYLYVNAPDDYTSFAGSFAVMPSTADTTSFHTILMKWNSAGGGKAALDGTVIATSPATGANGTLGDFSIGNLTSQHMTGDIAEIIVCAANLGTADYNNVGNYLAAKYGLTWTPMS